jgi:hypothetical protein
VDKTMQAIVGGLILLGIMAFIIAIPGKVLRQKFISLNPLRGRSKKEIIRRVGSPSATTYVEGGTVLQWMRSSYHITVIFGQDDICQGVTHEYKASWIGF